MVKVRNIQILFREIITNELEKLENDILIYQDKKAFCIGDITVTPYEVDQNNTYCGSIKKIV